MQDALYARDGGNGPIFELISSHQGSSIVQICTMDELRIWYDRNGMRFFGHPDEWEAASRISEIEQKFTTRVASDFAMITQKHADREAARPDLD